MVASYTQLLEKRYAGQLDEKALRYIHYAADGAHRMQALITDLLAYSRVNSASQDLRLTDTGYVVEHARRNVEAAVAEAGALITCDPLPGVLTDAAQLCQVFQNLFSNAIKFRRGPGPRIHVSVAETESEWIFSVKDDGIGIDPQYTGRIFEIFKRLHSRADYPGTGIGLAICRRVVERHGGRIWAESQPGAGSTFFFTLPKCGREGAEYDGTQ